MLRYLLPVLLLASATPAAAEAITLDCSSDHDSSIQVSRVDIDTDARTLTYHLVEDGEEGSYSYEMPILKLSGQEILSGEDQLGGSVTRFEFWVDRTTGKTKLTHQLRAGGSEVLDQSCTKVETLF